jgi:hypothetical protein
MPDDDTDWGDSVLDPGFDEFDGWAGVPDWKPNHPDGGLYWDLIQ